MSKETIIRLSLFFGVLTIVSLWEYIAPRRILNHSKPKRWLSNLGITFLNSILIDNFDYTSFSYLSLASYMN
jgi:hypothetical protein